MKDFFISNQLEDLEGALSQIEDLFKFGKKKYPKRAWNQHGSKEEALKFVESRMGSLSRHHAKAQQDPTSIDDESKAMHLVATAWNALVCAQLLMDIEDGKFMDKID